MAEQEDGSSVLEGAPEKVAEKATDNLSTYRAKRSPDTSPEPTGTIARDSGNLFVVHKHAARQLHFDLRLEMDGVLRSWAVPKGPSYNTEDKRLAVKVEDHPIEYGDFEGIIPAGNYGAGGVIVWDRGQWVPLEDWRTGLEKGKLLFELNGYKLHGRWTLVKIKKSERDWLLIKERDAYVQKPGDVFPEESVLSGLTVDELKAGFSPARTLRETLEAKNLKRDTIDPHTVGLMLAEPVSEAFTREGWLFELKLDGYRMLAVKSNDDVLLITRNNNDYTNVFPEVVRAVRALPLDECIIDGEIVVHDPQGKPSFARLQKRGALHSINDIRRAAVQLPATFYAFDMLSLEGFDLRPLPLIERKEILMSALPKLGAVHLLDHIEKEGERFLMEVASIGLEGIIAKRADSPYHTGRSDCWLKIKAEPTSDFVIVGFTGTNGSRAHFGALQLADYVGGQLVYAGRVGTGFDDAALARLHAMLVPIVRNDPPCEGPVTGPETRPLPSSRIPNTKTTTWVDPVYVCEVRFREWTPDGFLRHPAFVRMRPDKNARDCERQHWVHPQPEMEADDEMRKSVAVHEAPAAPVVAPAEKTVAFSNLKKVYWPAEKITKGEFIEYYRAASRWMLPYLHDRPVVLTRYPDGIEGKSFYQKDAPEFAPEWMQTVPIWSEDTQREVRYFICNDVESLLYIANSASIPIHIWASRIGQLEQPDWCVMDLDPKEAPFSNVVRCAQVLHEICESISLPNFVKTTGKTGLHILLPLPTGCTYAQSRTLGELLARLVLLELNDIATITRHVTKRGDKVYLDYLQNRHGQTIVAPFSVRPLPGATVSMPLTWDEVNDNLDPKDFTIRTAIARMEKLGDDPVSPVLNRMTDLDTVLKKLAARMG